MTSTGWVLCVDDEERVLSGLELELGFDYEVTTATSGAAGLEALRGNKNCAVIISDMRMPHMNGAAFLAKAREIAPDSTRMLLTGYSEVEAAISAINEGGIFRFLTKPTNSEVLKQSVEQAFRQWELVRSERVLLEQTVRGAASALTEALEIASPDAFSRARRLESGCRHTAQRLSITPTWEVALAGLLLRLGWISLPQEVVTARLGNGSLSNEQSEMLSEANDISVRLIRRIPRLGGVADLVAKAANPSGRNDGPTVVAAVAALDDQICAGSPLTSALDAMANDFPVAMIDALSSWPLVNEELQIRLVKLRELREGMVVESHILTTDRQLLVRAGSQLTTPLIQRLRNFHRSKGVAEPIRVSMPTK